VLENLSSSSDPGISIQYLDYIKLESAGSAAMYFIYFAAMITATFYSPICRLNRKIISYK